jgi:hypothetical protein
MIEQVYGLTAQQHEELGYYFGRNRDTRRPPQEPPAAATFPGTCRVIAMAADDPTYQPRVPRQVGVFKLHPDGSQTTIEFSGHALEGDLVLTIAGVQMQIDCRATTSQLREKLQAAGIQARDCRATVFPGLWEFDFNGGRWSDSPPSLQALPFDPPAEDTETPVFSGQLRVTREAWLSVTRNRLDIETILCRDWIPHKNGAIKAGAIGAVVWSHEAGFLCIAWQCRDYSFQTGN